MASKIFMFLVCFSICTTNGLCSLYTGNEETLRQNIADLLDGKLALSKTNLPYEKDELTDTTPNNHTEYDFIVIGAGSAGSVIASRLSEIKNITILLIEAGGKEYSILNIPSLASSPIEHEDVIWSYSAEPSNNYCLAQKDGKCRLPAGKVMGGSSTVGSLMAMRGNRRDYDQWAIETQDDSWSYKSMLKYLKKLENFHGNGIVFDKDFRNEGGPVHVTVARDRFKISEAFIDAGKEMGYSEVDNNGPEQVGFSYSQTTTFKGEKWSGVFRLF